MDFFSKEIPSFGVAGNFTGHLEQAGEARDFTNIKAAEANAPKALFPTYLPGGEVSKNAQVSTGGDGALADFNSVTPEFLHLFPFSSDKIIFPKNEEKLQIEPECAILCDLVWNGDEIVKVIPKTFAASNDCSIRKEGAKKISMKKNWGPSSKGLSENQIEITGPETDGHSFTKDGILNNYRIASFLVRDGIVNDYGEDSAVRDYSYVYEKLLLWITEKLNNQKDEGPAENIHSYLVESGKPAQVMVSIGATRYTDFGEHNFLADGDRAVVVLYPEAKYSHSQISEMVRTKDYSDSEVSVLDQVIVL